MFDLPPVLFHSLVVLVGLLLYTIVWRCTMTMPRLPKLLSRLALSVVFILPLIFTVAAVYRGPERQATASRAPQPDDGVSERRIQPPSGSRTTSTEMATGAKRSPVPGGSAQRQPEAAPPPPPPAPVTMPAAPSPVPVAPSAPAPGGLARSGTGEGGGGGVGAGSVGAPPAGTSTQAEPEAPVRSAEAPAPSVPASRWDVVPVFYGTDRSREPNVERVAYTPGRAKRLELGRALITVPKSHEVPLVERPWVYKLPFTEIVVYREKEDPEKHFTLKEIRQLSQAEFLALVRERLALSKNYEGHALVFIHGFSVAFDNALYRTAQIAYDLKFDGAPFLYSWPSNGAISHGDYSSDRESTGQAEPYLKEFLTLVSRETGAKKVSVIAHSMGNQLLLRVLRDLKQSAPDSVSISEIILAAPDVDRDTFEFLAKEIKGVAGGMTLLAAANDRALEVSRRFWGGTPRAGEVPLDLGPVIIEGLDTIDITAINNEVFSLNHSGYAEKPALLRDIEALIKTGARPPTVRLPGLEVKSGSTGSYWSYPPAN